MTASAVAAVLGCSTAQPISAVAFGIAAADLFPKRSQGANAVADALMRAETAKAQTGYDAEYVALDRQRTALQKQDADVFEKMKPYIPLLQKNVPDPPAYTTLFTQRQTVDHELGDVQAAILRHFDTPLATAPLVHKTHCTINGEDIAIDVYTDSGQRKNAESAASTIGCDVAKGFGIDSVSYVVGANWTATAQGETTTNLMARQSGTNVKTLHCG